VRTALSERVIGVELDRLRSTPHGVCVAGGLQKAEAIRGALLAGFVDVLVTDHATARKVLAGG
jgi:DNA-binding transcriptional regulator LsrR (DeoR family)